MLPVNTTAVVVAGVWQSKMSIQRNPVHNRTETPGRGRGLLGCVVASHIILRELYVERFTVTPCSQKLVVALRTPYCYTPEKTSAPGVTTQRIQH